MKKLIKHQKAVAEYEKLTEKSTELDLAVYKLYEQSTWKDIKGVESFKDACLTYCTTIPYTTIHDIAIAGEVTCNITNIDFIGTFSKASLLKMRKLSPEQQKLVFDTAQKQSSYCLLKNPAKLTAEVVSQTMIYLRLAKQSVGKKQPKRNTQFSSLKVALQEHDVNEIAHCLLVVLVKPNLIQSVIDELKIALDSTEQDEEIKVPEKPSQNKGKAERKKKKSKKGGRS